MDIEQLTEIPPWQWPTDAGTLLQDAVGDRSADVSVRTLAAELASSTVVMDDELARTLISIVEDPDEPDELRATAAISLGPALEEADLDLDYDAEDSNLSEGTLAAVQQGLRGVYMDPEAPKHVRRRVLEASIRAPEAWHDGAVRAAYHSGDAEWRVTAVFCMALRPGFEDEILEAVESSDPALRFEGVRAAGRRGLRAAWTTVRALLGSRETDRPLLLAAIEAAAGVRPDEAPAALDPFLHSEDEEISAAAEDALEWVRLLAADPEENGEEWGWPDGEGWGWPDGEGWDGPPR